MSRPLKAKRSFDSAILIFHFSTLMGIVPMQLRKRNGSTTIITNRYLFVITAFHIIVAILILLYSVDNLGRIGLAMSRYNTVYKATTWIAYFLMVTSSIVLLLIGMSKMALKCNYTKDIATQMCIVLVGPCLYLVIFVLEILTIDKSSPMKFSVQICVIKLYTSILLSVIESQIALIVLAMRGRFYAINVVLTAMCNRVCDYQKHAEKNKTSGLMLSQTKLLMYLHDSLCDISRKANSAYAFPIFISVSTQLSIQVLKLCDIAILNRGVMEIIPDVLWLVAKTFEAWRVMISNALLGYEFKRTAAKVHKLLNVVQDSSVAYELMIFSRQLLHANVRITAGGMFKYDLRSVALIEFLGPAVLIMLRYNGDVASDPNAT